MFIRGIYVCYSEFDSAWDVSGIKRSSNFEAVNPCSHHRFNLNVMWVKTWLEAKQRRSMERAVDPVGDVAPTAPSSDPTA